MPRDFLLFTMAGSFKTALGLNDFLDNSFGIK